MNLTCELPAGVSLSDSRNEYASESSIPLIRVETPLCRAVLALQGAQLLSFVPESGRDWLWLSPQAEFAPGKAVRGGIPLCLPWFGVNRRRPELPKHGWLRQRDWQLQAASCDAEGVVTLQLATASLPSELPDFPWVYEVEVEYRLGREIELELRVRNCSSTVMPLSFAAHSYFSAIIEQAQVFGLGSGRFLDNTDSLLAKQQVEPQTFFGEVDRVFEGAGGRQRLLTGSQTLDISGEGCDTLVIWNPGERLAADMKDVGGGYRDYVCVERGMAFADELALAPGDDCVARMVISPAT